MPPKTEKRPIEVVAIDSSSDDEDCVGVVAATGGTLPTVISKPAPSQSKTQWPRPPLSSSQQLSPEVVSPSVSSDQTQTLEFRSFWKAGALPVAPTVRKSLPQGQLEHARVHPKFLHSNATSHKWAFGAIAELLDNAVDEIHNGATFVKVDKIDIVKDNSPALLFQDDGSGMDPDSIRKCMSLGYSSKKSKTTIGQYGNGFKTSTMRLGADVIVFSRSIHAGKATQSIGLLSYTFLRKTGQDDVIVPLIDFDISGHWAEPIIYSSQDDWSSNLKTILEWSPFTSKDELMQQFEDIGPHGTKILIYNLWLNDEGIYELSFDDDDEDIRLRDEANHGGQTKLHKRTVELQSHISYQIRYSLRAYTSILYLRKFANFNIILRGKPVQQYIIADDLQHAKKVIYKPQLAMTSKEVNVETTIGFIKEAPSLSVCGFNVYHKNRLIRPYWKVTGDGSSKGNGVVGVLEANFIEPAHDKQDFERSTLFIRLEAKLKQILMEYWNKHCQLVGHQPPGSSAHSMQKGHAPKSHKQQPDKQYGISRLADFQEVDLDNPVNSLQHMNNRQFGNGIRSNHTVQQPATVFAAGSCDELEYEYGPGLVAVDQICEENIQLFMRCEEERQKEAALKQTVEELAKELEQAKRKCAQLSAHLEAKKKQKIIKQQLGEKVS